MRGCRGDVDHDAGRPGWLVCRIHGRLPVAVLMEHPVFQYRPFAAVVSLTDFAGEVLVGFELAAAGVDLCGGDQVLVPAEEQLEQGRVPRLFRLLGWLCASGAEDLLPRLGGAVEPSPPAGLLAFLIEVAIARGPGALAVELGAGASARSPRRCGGLSLRGHRVRSRATSCGPSPQRPNTASGIRSSSRPASARSRPPARDVRAASHARQGSSAGGGWFWRPIG